jgi:hypothetical protein
MRDRAMHNADVNNDVRCPIAVAARQQDPSLKILHAGLKAHLAT